ncbi:MAG: SIS domain-containing protein [Candidatus Xenobia bacterium]
MLSQKDRVTYNEIMEQPAVWQATLDTLAAVRGDLQAWMRQEQIGQFLFVGCGSSYHAGMVAARTIHMITGYNAWAVPASEVLLMARPPYDPRIKTLQVFISRSGETTETLWALQRLQQLHRGAPMLAITTRGDSPLAQMTNKKIELTKAQEQSVVATKSFTSSVLAGQMLAAWMLPDDRFVNELARIPGSVDLEKRKVDMQKVGSGIKPVPLHMVACGHGPFTGIAHDTALKFKQMTMTSAEVTPTLELRHGLWSALRPDTIVMFFVSETLKLLEDDVVWEAAKLQPGARIAICEQASTRMRQGTEHVVELNSSLMEPSRAVPMAALAHVIAFYLAIAKGTNPDKPKGSANVVRVKTG